MGLDCWFGKTEDDDQLAFRGRQYNPYVKLITGYSLYNPYSKEEVKEIAYKLRYFTNNVANDDSTVAQLLLKTEDWDYFCRIIVDSFILAAKNDWNMYTSW